MKPLEGLRVIELARVLAGPWAGQTLSDLGAEVIKIEAPSGDDTRLWGPPFIGQGEDRFAAYFQSTNRRKASVVADLKSDEGRKLVRDLSGGADVLIENFKVGGLKRYGLDYDSLSAHNPGLVYCSITGFGQDGPAASRAGYDLMIQGLSGFMSITGEPDGAPTKTGVAITDLFTGLYSVIAIQAALAQRAVTGKGQWIDMALFDTAVAVTANQGLNYLTTDTAPGRLGNAHPNLTPYEVFAVSDGWAIIAVGNDGQFQRLCDVLGLQSLGTNPDFATNAARLSRRAQLKVTLDTALANWKRDELLSSLAGVGVPAGAINDIGQALSEPQAIHRGLKAMAGDVPAIRSPMRFSNAETAAPSAAPTLDQDGDRIRAKGWRSRRPVDPDPAN